MSRVAGAFQRASVPLAVYYGVTLALPLANGAAESGRAFGKHALAVLVVPLVLVALRGAIHAIYDASAVVVVAKRHSDAELL